MSITNQGSGSERSHLVAFFLSLIMPGLGHVWLRHYQRGISIFLAIVTALATVFWYKHPAWYILPAALWLWNLWDVIKLPKGASIIFATFLWLTIAYGIGWQVTETHPLALFQNRERAQSILGPMLRPDFLTTRENRFEYWVEIQIPCTSSPPHAENTMDKVHILASPDCATFAENVLITANGLRPDFNTEVTWVTPTGGVLMLGEKHSKMLVMNADSEGSLAILIQVPPGAHNEGDPTLIHRIYLTQREKLPGISLSTNGRYIIQGVYETLSLALLATTLGAILALPLGFLAAHNLMSGNPITMLIYFLVRTLLNFIRSIETLIFAIIFVIIVGLGPFPGMLAITLHTIAALGKLYSEVIEGIDSGPIEAVRATGADWVQIVRYAVIPQIVPPFTALTIYRWDINVRSSTIIGFVGGGGIGFFLYQWIIIGDYRAVSSSFIAIAVVVIVLDFFSARLRERII